MGGIPSGEGGDRFPLLLPPSPPKSPDLGGDLAVGDGGDAPGGALHGSEEEEWEGV